MKQLLSILGLSLIPIAQPHAGAGTGLGASLERAAASEGVAGKWTGMTPVPGKVELEAYELTLEPGADGTLRGAVETAGGEVIPVAGTWDPAAKRAALTGDTRGQELAFALELKEGRLVGTLDLFGGTIAVDAARPSAAVEAAAPLVVDLSVERPAVVSLSGLPAELAALADETLSGVEAVGISAAFVVNGQVIDVRSRGWEDFHQRIPASAETSYRWASISKPLTAVAALQLAEVGKLDLDRDVREYVPEFPEKRWTMTPRQLLCHQAGVAHYQHMRVRTLKEYDLEHPWADAIVALDMFNETDLLFEPGTDYSYTTPGFVLLGAAIESAGKGTYVEQVQARICKPLGMTSMQPDRQWVEIPHRTRGYHKTGDGRVVDSGDDNICWKLAAGGWTSTVVDLARFGAGLMGPGLLGLDTQLAMWTPQVTSTGERTDYGLGIGVATLGDVQTISHSGAQLKTATYLIASPDYGMAVAMMCNTQRTGLGDPARTLLRAMIEHYSD